MKFDLGEFGINIGLMIGGFFWFTYYGKKQEVS